MVRNGRISVWLLLVALLLPGCRSFYRVEVGGEVPESAHSVFLIVADKDPTESVKSEDLVRLIRSDRHSKYLLFAQFDPDKGRPMRWRQQSLRGDSDMLRVRISEDETQLILSVDRALLESYRDLTIVALGHGTDGWYMEVCDAGKIRTEGGVHFDIGTSRFVRRLSR